MYFHLPATVHVANPIGLGEVLSGVTDEKNGHVAYRLECSNLLQSFLEALALRRRDKGKLAARRGRKAYGPPC